MWAAGPGLRSALLTICAFFPSNRHSRHGLLHRRQQGLRVLRARHGHCLVEVEKRHPGQAPLAGQGVCLRRRRAVRGLLWLYPASILNSLL